MYQVVASYILHNNQRRIMLRFGNDILPNTAIKSITSARWSNTFKSWHIPANKEVYNAFKKLLPPGCHINETSANAIIKGNRQDVAATPLPPALNQANANALKLYVQHLQLKAYSRSTIKTYKNAFSIFLQTLAGTAADSLSTQRVKDYLEYCLVKLKLSENTIHSRVNAIKFYYEQVLHREKFFWEIPRPKKPLLLPKVLNQDELRNLFNALQNKKHKAMLFTAYSAGLRVSEIVNLKLNDIDSTKMQIFIKRAKGKKDRYVNLSPVLLDVLRKYIMAYQPKPTIFLFESDQTKAAYPVRTIQQIFYNARVKAGISKDVGIHSLRHSFATHLLDKGTDIRYIKDLLGHFDIRTTERYLHVSKQQLVNIVSPLDDLYKNEAIDW